MTDTTTNTTEPSAELSATAGAASTSVAEEYAHFFEVRLDLFDGPIDLLLHLVKAQELPIEKVSLALIAEQYLACITKAKGFDLEIAGEYLVIAATLLAIKSNLLLNQPVELVEDEEGNLTDPHEELIRRLKELEAFKQGAFLLSCRKQLGVDVFAPPSMLGDVEPPPPTYKLHDPILLGLAFKKLLDKLPVSSGIKIKIESVSVVERMKSILEILNRSSEPVVFHALIPDLTSRPSIIGSFIALLELCKRQLIRIAQNETFSEITIGLRSEGGADSANALSSEFDEQSEQGEQGDEASNKDQSAAG